MSTHQQLTEVLSISHNTQQQNVPRLAMRTSQLIGWYHWHNVSCVPI